MMARFLVLSLLVVTVFLRGCLKSLGGNFYPSQWGSSQRRHFLLETPIDEKETRKT